MAEECSGDVRGHPDGHCKSLIVMKAKLIDSEPRGVLQREQQMLSAQPFSNNKVVN